MVKAAEDLTEQRQTTYDALERFAKKRADWYRDKTKVNLKGLLSKDVVMFASRGFASADEFVVEAFHAMESTSEETVMGTLRQEICAVVSTDTLDTGDMTTLRDGNLYVCELKSQKNTVNSSSFPQELRELKDKCETLEHFRRASRQKVLPAFCVMRSNKYIGIETNYCQESWEARRYLCLGISSKSSILMRGQQPTTARSRAGATSTQRRRRAIAAQKGSKAPSEPASAQSSRA